LRIEKNPRQILAKRPAPDPSHGASIHPVKGLSLEPYYKRPVDSSPGLIDITDFQLKRACVRSSYRDARGKTPKPLIGSYSEPSHGLTSHISGSRLDVQDTRINTYFEITAATGASARISIV
jgi:hypothetical protein